MSATSKAFNDPDLDIEFDEKTINPAEEFMKDGVVYCKICKEPRTIYSDFFKKYFRQPCRCQREAFKAAELKKAAGLGQKNWDVTFDNTEIYSIQFEVVYKRLKKYCQVADVVLDRGIGVYLYGDRGVGKSRLTACMVDALTKQLYSVLFTNFDNIALALKASFDKNTASGMSEKEIMDKLDGVDFLFIDDFGTEKVTKNGEDMWLQTKVYDIVNARYENKKPIIFTSNYSLQELAVKRGIDAKTVDRIVETTATIKLEGQSYRRKIHDQQKLPF